MLDDFIKQVSKLVSKGKTDREISELFNKPLKEIYQIRTTTLKATTKKRKCSHCNQMRNPVCFSSKYDNTPQAGWCIVCRRQAGIDLYQRKQKENKKGQKREIRLYNCLRCNKLFESETWEPNYQHYHTCPHCRRLMNAMENISI